MGDVHRPIRVNEARLGWREQSTTWVFYELDYVRREAQAEADFADEAWCPLPGADGYAVYRAAQDRADAAQDQLADYASRSCADR